MSDYFGVTKMYKIDSNFGYNVSGETIGEAWISLVEAVFKYGKISFDESRKRRALNNIRLRSETQDFQDPIIYKYGNVKNIKSMLELTFNNSEMYDFDLTPSFSKGAKSYYQRIKEGKMINFVVERLSRIPESKKAVIVFPTYEDYEAVLKDMKDDYLPCLVSLQFRLDKIGRKYKINTTFNFRSMDVFQKGHGNLEAISMITFKIAKKIGKKLGKTIELGFLDGIIVDAHIYENTWDDAKKIILKYQEER